MPRHKSEHVRSEVRRFALFKDRFSDDIVLLSIYFPSTRPSSEKFLFSLDHISVL